MLNDNAPVERLAFPTPAFTNAAASGEGGMTTGKSAVKLPCAKRSIAIIKATKLTATFLVVLWVFFIG